MKNLLKLSVVLIALNGYCQGQQSIEEWKKYFNENILSLDKIEGLYKSNWYDVKYYDGELMYNNPMTGEGELQNYIDYSAILKIGDGEYQKYAINELKGVSWQDFIIVKTNSSSKYIRKNDIPSGNWTDYSEISYYDGEFKITWSMPYEMVLKEYVDYWKEREKIPMSQLERVAATTKRLWVCELLMVYPTTEMKIRSVEEKKPLTGTAFAISSDGIIITNYHIISNDNKITVRGINSDFNTRYEAKVLISDRINDISLLKVENVEIENIPFVIKTEILSVGENIFVLGYPLLATMGDEIKLTNGIISSRTGFQGDVTSYQISAPVQPGNSGGPLFDSQGNLIGIINAKHIGAENAGYAVKTSYLTNLIELLQSPPKLQTANSLNGKTLSQQVELVKKFVYIIETE